MVVHILPKFVQTPNWYMRIIVVTCIQILYIQAHLNTPFINIYELNMWSSQSALVDLI